MEKDLFQNSNEEQGWLWLLKIIAGLSLVIFLTIHFYVNHLYAPGGLLTYSDIIHFYSNPIVPIIESAFLIFAVIHCLLGIRSIILDLNPQLITMRIINFILIITGIVSISYGIWLIVVLVNRN